MKNNKGFTLIELLIVVAIIGLLATLAIISLTSAQSKARDTKRVADLNSLQSAVEMYYNDYNGYPVPTDGDWGDFGTALGDYVNALPATPGAGVSPDIYQYSTNATGTFYCLQTQLESDTTQVLSQDNDDGNDCGNTSTVQVASDGTTSAPLVCPATEGGELCLTN